MSDFTAGSSGQVLPAPAFGYRPLRRLNAGGRVWLARGPEGARAVLKYLPPALGAHGSAEASEEAMVLATLAHAEAPGVARLIDFEAHQGGQVLLLDWYGRGAHRLLGPRAGGADAAGSRVVGAAGPYQAAGALLSTLIALQRNAVVHGAIRQEHLALDGEGSPVLLGFGRSRSLTGSAAPWRDRRARADAAAVARLALSTPVQSEDRAWWTALWAELMESAGSETWSLDALEATARTLAQRGGVSAAEQLEWAEVPQKPQWLRAVAATGPVTLPGAAAPAAVQEATAGEGALWKRLGTGLGRVAEEGIGPVLLEPARVRLRALLERGGERSRSDPAERHDGFDGGGDPGPGSKARPRPAAARSRLLLFGAIVFAAVTLAALLWPGGSRDDAGLHAAGVVTDGSAGTDGDRAAWGAPAAASSTEVRVAPGQAAADPSVQEQAVLRGDDPLPALAVLLRVRQRCFQEQSLLCLEQVLQSTSPQSLRDRGELHSPDAVPRAAALAGQAQAAVLIERYGDAALLGLPADGTGAVLLMREDGAWRIRELLPGQGSQY